MVVFNALVDVPRNNIDVGSYIAGPFVGDRSVRCVSRKKFGDSAWYADKKRG